LCEPHCFQIQSRPDRTVRTGRDVYAIRLAPTVADCTHNNETRVVRSLGVELSEIVAQFAAAMTAADSRKPVAVSPRSGRTYQPGIGPHPEDRGVDPPPR
jgi:hypothetical protein